MVDTSIGLLKKGTKGVVDFVQQVFAKFKKWLDELTGGRVGWLSYKLIPFGNDGITVRNLIRLKNRTDDGWYNVLCHGDPKHVIINGRKLKPKEFADMLLENGYEPGNKIRLVSCHTGAKKNGFAAKLSEILEVEVTAPTNKVAVDDLGEFVHKDNGKFVVFTQVK